MLSILLKFSYSLYLKERHVMYALEFKGGDLLSRSKPFLRGATLLYVVDGSFMQRLLSLTSSFIKERHVIYVSEFKRGDLFLGSNLFSQTTTLLYIMDGSSM